jgi:hypothetical protein
LEQHIQYYQDLTTIFRFSAPDIAQCPDITHLVVLSGPNNIFRTDALEQLGAKFIKAVIYGLGGSAICALQRVGHCFAKL